MALSDSRWNTINPSSFPWERDALDFIRERLPDHHPYLAWANFEFLAQDGSINEVDLLVLAPSGLYLVEIKSRPGLVKGDAGTWTWEWDGKSVTDDSPLLLANRKAQRLAVLLRAQRDFQHGQRPPYVQAVVFCSAPALRVQLDERGRQHVCQRDVPAADGKPARPGIVALLTETSPARAAHGRARVDLPTARAVARGIQQIGIRPTQRSRKVGDFKLERLIVEGPGYQDWEASHAALEDVKRRVRLYPVADGTSTLSRRTLERAAQREFQILEGVRHPGILPAVAFTQHERGPALVFEHEPGAVRLDLLLHQRGARLPLDVRLDLLRQLAEALKHAHERRLYHRALSPQSVLVCDPDKARPRARIFNWQTGRRDPGSGAPPGAAGTRTTHLGELIEDAARVYLAPEALSHPDADPEALDVFSLGAIAYHLFSGQPPAASALDLADKLRQDRGLQVSAVLDGAGQQLQELIFNATCAQVAPRPAGMGEFLVALEAVEEELTTPDRPQHPDPIEANKGDTLDGGFTVVKRLGKGSSAVALEVKRGDRTYVLKVALAPEHHERLRAEGELLAGLPRHQHVCAVHETLEIGGRLALLMDKAGEQTLGQRLRAEGRLHLELLERFGEDLLETLDWLEQQGVAHRDVKPENIGIAPVGRGDRLHLVLFDFSLARTPAENIRAGTVPYLDAFLVLRKPARWDLHAERFAAAMTLHEMATGVLPVWGEDRSDPAMLDDEVTLDPARFDPDLRAAMTAFFQKALRRDYRERFGNTVEMLRAWRKVFSDAERRPPAPAEPAGDVLVGEALASAALDTKLAALGLGTRALNALDRANVIDVRGLLRLPLMQLSSMRGVGHKTRREIVAVAQRLAARFPGVTPVAGEPPPPQPGAPAPEALRLSLDLLADRLVPSGRGQPGSESLTLRALLGLGDATEGREPDTLGLWPSQTDVGRARALTRARVGQIVGQARKRWASDQAVAELANEAVRLLTLRGGAMTAGELAAALVTTRGSVHVEPQRTRLAFAAARAVVEAEQARDEPRLVVTRSGVVVLVASSDDLADYALRLGRAADQLAAEDPPPAPARVLDTLQRVTPPAEHDPPAPARLVALAAAASQRAAFSSRLEIYPRGLDPLATLRLAHGALLGAATLTPAQLRARVTGRYPDAQPLPERPALDELLRAAGLDLVWDDAARAYRTPQRRLLSSATSSPQRYNTTLGRPTEVTPEIAEARQFHARLQYAYEHGGFLALSVEPRRLRDAEDELCREFTLERRSLEEMLIRAMRDEARRAGADWTVVRRADAAPRDSSDWSTLLRLVRLALPQVERDIGEAAGRLLLVHPGLLARYDQVAFLGRLRDVLGQPGRPHALWVLFPSDGGSALPVLDGRPIPVLTPGQWARLPEPWIQNQHRGHVPASGTSASPA